MVRWCSGFVQVPTPRSTRFESQQVTLFFNARGGGTFSVVIFYFETWIVGSFAYFFAIFFFNHFLIKFTSANRPSPDGRKVPARFDGLLGNPYWHRKHYALVICNHGTQPRRGRVIELCFRFFIVSAMSRKYQGFVSYR